MAEAIVDQIREKYPKPRSQPPFDVKRWRGYCVMGAAIKYFNPTLKGENYRFPLPTTASDLLRIPVETASVIAEVNDDCDFTEAWRLLDQALSKGIEEPIRELEYAL